MNEHDTSYPGQLGGRYVSYKSLSPPRPNMEPHATTLFTRRPAQAQPGNRHIGCITDEGADMMDIWRDKKKRCLRWPREFWAFGLFVAPILHPRLLPDRWADSVDFWRRSASVVLDIGVKAFFHAPGIIAITPLLGAGAHINHPEDLACNLVMPIKDDNHLVIPGDQQFDVVIDPSPESFVGPIAKSIDLLCCLTGILWLEVA